MKRLFTATCMVAAFAVGATAQSGQSSTASSGQGGRSVTLTGCVRAGDTAGTYELTDVAGLPMGRRGADTSAASGATTATSGATTGEAAPAQSRSGRGMNTVMLNASSGVDLAAHVGHKIEVTGSMGGGRMGGSAATTGSTASGAATSTGSATTGAQAGSGTMSGRQGRGMRTVNVTSVKMLSSSCGS